MFRYSYRRSLWRRASRYLPYLLGFLFLLDVFRLLGAYDTFSKNLATSVVPHVEDLPRDARNQKVFITAQFWTSQEPLTGFWLENFRKLLLTLGRENVYVSIIGSGSFDYTEDIMHWLDGQLEELGIERTVIIDPSTHEDAVNAGPYDEHGNAKSGWILTGDSDPSGQKELRRIPYLSDLRNQGLEPLLKMHRQEGRVFDRILYLNDVYFQPSDILTLLATNGGHYDVACGIDFHYPPALYDTFALRDIEGRGPVMASFPYFRAADTRNAILNGRPARVKSCWNGVLAVDALPYYDQVEANSVSAGHKISNGLRFRGVADTLALKHVEASECCLIHADLIASGQALKGIFLNPAVRTGYTTEAYERTHRRSKGGFVSAWQYVFGVYRIRIARWKSDGISSSAGQDMGEVYKRITEWQVEGSQTGKQRVEAGGYCTILEMHILIWNGWKHVWWATLDIGSTCESFASLTNSFQREIDDAGYVPSVLVKFLLLLGC